MRVLRRGRSTHTAIEVQRGTKFALLIPMDSSGLSVDRVRLEKVNGEWSEMDYPVHRAADKYLRATKHLGGSARAISLLKEILMHYIIDKSGKVVQAGNKKEMQVAFSHLPEDQRLGGTFVASTREDLMVLSLVALSELYNSMVEPEDAVKKFGNKEGATERAWDALEFQHDPKLRARQAKSAAKEEKVAKANKTTNAPGTTAVPRVGSKMGALVEVLQKGKPLSLSDLASACGYDDANTRTAIGILRAKKGLNIVYNREDKEYQLAA